MGGPSSEAGEMNDQSRDALVEIAVFEVFERYQNDLDLLVVCDINIIWSAEELKEYIVKLETEVREAVRATYQSWYKREHDQERREAVNTIAKGE